MSKRAQKGFTLIEIIITLTITAIVGIFLATYLGPQIQIFRLNSQQSDARSACIGIINELQNRLNEGTGFELAGQTLTYTLVSENNNHDGQTIDLEQIGGQLFPNLKRSGLTAVVALDLNYSPSAYPAILITVTVQTMENTENKKDAEEIYTLSQAVRCPNYSLLE